MTPRLKGVTLTVVIVALLSVSVVFADGEHIYPTPVVSVEYLTHPHVRLSWDGPGGNVAYDVWLWEEVGGWVLVHRQGSDVEAGKVTTTVWLEKEKVDYYITIRAVDFDGGHGGWSEYVIVRNDPSIEREFVPTPTPTTPRPTSTRWPTETPGPTATPGGDRPLPAGPCILGESTRRASVEFQKETRDVYFDIFQHGPIGGFYISRVWFNPQSNRVEIRYSTVNDPNLYITEYWRGCEFQGGQIQNGGTITKL